MSRQGNKQNVYNKNSGSETGHRTALCSQERNHTLNLITKTKAHKLVFIEFLCANHGRHYAQVMQRWK